MSSPIKQNTEILQNLLNTINNLPEAGGVDLPELTNPASPSEVFKNKEVIDSAGNKVTGTFTIDTELSTQDNLISQIQSALEGKAGGGVTLPTLTNPATGADILSGKEAIDGSGNKITGSIATVTQATPSVSVSTSGLITASATQTAGYVSAGTKSGTKQLTTQSAKTITPSTSSQTAVASGVYTTGAVTVAAIPSSYVQPSGTKTITTNGTHDVTNYASATVNVASTSGASLPTIGMSVMASSTATGTIIYSDANMDGSINLVTATLNKMGSTYRVPISESALCNVPLIFITSGTPNVPNGTQIASGTGYYVYKFVAQTGSEDEDLGSGDD